MEIIDGQITDITEDGTLIIKAPYGNIDRYILRKYDGVQIGLPDGRSITPKQRAKAYALLSDISAWVGDYMETVKEQLKLEFMVNRMTALIKHHFSLSDVDETTAREFIIYLTDFCLVHGVPTHQPLWEDCPDIERYVYVCAAKKKCAVCGRDGVDLHHALIPLGMGADRTTKPQLGWSILSLCRQHHEEYHNGEQNFFKRYHLLPVALDETLAKVYNLPKETRKPATEFINARWHFDESGRVVLVRG
jgi:hypothetical protein